MRDGDRCYAASTYALCDALSAQRRGADDVPPLMYAHLRGKFSLVEKEPAWADLERAAAYCQKPYVA